MPRWSPPDVATRRLVRRLNAGDADALAMLYDAYAERLFDYAAAMTGDVRAADDIVHDALVDAWRRAPRIRDHANLRIWLYGAVRRRCLQRGGGSELRWEPNRPFRYPGPRRSRRADARPSAVLPPTAELRSLLESAVNRLDANERELLLLTVRHGLHPAELGLLWGLSRRRVAALTGEARADLEVSLRNSLALAAGSCARWSAGAPPRRTDWANGTSTERTGTSSRPRADSGVCSSASSSAPASASSGQQPRAAGQDVVRAGARGRGRARSVLRLDAPARFGGRGAGSTRPDPRSASGRRAAGPTRSRPGDASRPGGRRTESDACSQDIIDSALDEHIRACAACRARGQVRAAGLLVLAPASAPSDALRRRVLHTATDPELAGYRADIAGRGGALTPEGLPTQPDIASPYARRWMFATGGMGGALLTALAAIVFMGSQLGVPTFDWPLRPLPSVTATKPNQHAGRDGRPQARGPAGGGGPQPPAPQFGNHSHAPTDPGKHGKPTTPPPPPTTPPVTPRPGTLKVLTTRLELYGRSSGTIRLKAEDGPVTWTGESSSRQITLQDRTGGLSSNGSRDVMVTLHTGLISLPGRATLTFTGAHGPPQQVTVVWGVSLL
ncbi:RNA polymerase sigma factor [Actinomadura oligospora]|uniref:RNA polymerase sigma factor n=1 Tax=Actinomadura oligospora TaxID=111804 RepID=UPI0004BC731A|nr:sigma-70 family RNA polymerase sigma factor [Actinomadura oligospora]